MRIILRIAAVLLLVLLAVGGAGFAWFMNRYPEVPPLRTVTLPTSPDAIARGEYLTRHVVACLACHSARDARKFAGPIVPGTSGRGGEIFDRESSGVPGTLYAPNITPAALRTWSDAELMRAVVDGISRDGRALFPIMPYVNFGQLAEDDIRDVLAYVRSLAPVENHPPDGSLDFPMNFIVRIIPRPATFGTRPSASDRVAYGKYMVTAAGCADCHTPLDGRGQPQPGLDFAGGFEFRYSGYGYRIRSANITPDADTGIGQWTEEQFVNKFKGMEADDDRLLNDAEQRQNTVMPWRQYGGMTMEDLGAIYAYLRSLKPVIHRVVTFPDAAPSH